MPGRQTVTLSWEEPRSNCNVCSLLAFFFLLPQNLFILLSNTCKPRTCFLYIFSAFFKLLQLFLKNIHFSFTSNFLSSSILPFQEEFYHFYVFNSSAIFNFSIGIPPALGHNLLLFHSITGVFFTEHTCLWLQVLGYFKTGNWCHFSNSLPPTFPSRYHLCWFNLIVTWSSSMVLFTLWFWQAQPTS